MSTEQEDLALLKAKVASIRELSFTMFREYLRMDEAGLKSCGHSSANSACMFEIANALKEIEKETKAFLKKWPDK